MIVAEILLETKRCKVANIDYIESIQSMIEFGGRLMSLDRKDRASWRTCLEDAFELTGLEPMWAEPDKDCVDLQSFKIRQSLRAHCTERELKLIVAMENSFLFLVRGIETALRHKSQRHPGQLTKRQHKIICDRLAEFRGETCICLGKLLRIKEPWYWHISPDEVVFKEARREELNDLFKTDSEADSKTEPFPDQTEN